MSGRNSGRSRFAAARSHPHPSSRARFSPHSPCNSCPGRWKPLRRRAGGQEQEVQPQQQPSLCGSILPLEISDSQRFIGPTLKSRYQRILGSQSLRFIVSYIRARAAPWSGTVTTTFLRRPNQLPGIRLPELWTGGDSAPKFSAEPLKFRRYFCVVAQILAVILFLLMFGLIVSEKIERHYIPWAAGF